MVENALRVSDILGEKGVSVGVVNARFIAPIDTGCLESIKDMPIYVLEDVIFNGSLAEKLLALGYMVTPFTLPNTYVTFGMISELQKFYRIDADSVVEAILKR